MIKGSIQEEDITIVNICVPSIEAPKYINQTLTQREKLTVNTITVGDFNTQLILVVKSSRNKINKGIPDLNYTLGQMNLTDILEHSIQKP